MSKPAEPRVENSKLWQRGFGDEGADTNVSRLVTSLRGIRRNVEVLTSRIAASLPELTLHDISHLDGLWEVADTVAGSEYPLNPIESYVFGASVLLHDAGLCFEAYTGGRDALRDTLEWRDAYGRLNRAVSGAGAVRSEADFEALRALHASQAARLAVKPWRDDEGEFFLIDDRELRENYGRLIGELASSHHWNLEMIVDRFATPRPPAAFLDADWPVDSLKIACMLRVSDAGHMDGTRAPSFLLRILQMNALSRSHWRAQNRLGRLTVGREDTTQVVIGSTSPFPRAEAAAWWVAFDLIDTFDRELRLCNEVLRDSSGGPRPTFARKSVAGAGQVKDLVRYVETVGWEPTESTVHVSDVAALVRNLGGDQLYGKDVDRLYVALRELIQNAADAIGVRRSLPGSGDFSGCVYVRLKAREDGGWTLQVDDDGVGMAQTTLTTDLLDFGRSFWSSRRAAREFPGVHASGYTPIGRFGIGFFSIFMAAKKVNVYSRRFDRGLDEVRCLSFERGISLRPTLSDERPDDLGMDLCTRVELELEPDVLRHPDRLTIRCNLQGQENFDVPFEDYVSSLVAGIGASVIVVTEKGSRRVHGGFPPKPTKRQEWLQNLAYLKVGVNKGVSVGLMRTVPRLREIRDGETCYGLAAVDVLQQNHGLFLSGKSVGGLVNPHSRFDNAFIGLIDHVPATAQRAAGDVAAPENSMTMWMAEQVSLLKDENLSASESLLASYSICQLGYDPIEILQGLFLSSGAGTRFEPMESIGDSIRSGVRVAFPLMAGVGNHLDPYVKPLRRPDLWACVVMKNGKFNDAELSAGVPSNPNSLIGIVQRVLESAGHSPTWLRHQAVYDSVVGQGDCLEVRV